MRTSLQEFFQSGSLPGRRQMVGSLAFLQVESPAQWYSFGLPAVPGLPRHVGVWWDTGEAEGGVARG